MLIALFFHRGGGGELGLILIESPLFLIPSASLVQLYWHGFKSRPGIRWLAKILAAPSAVLLASINTEIWAVFGIRFWKKVVKIVYHRDPKTSTGWTFSPQWWHDRLSRIASSWAVSLPVPEPPASRCRRWGPWQRSNRESTSRSGC